MASQIVVAPLLVALVTAVVSLFVRRFPRARTGVSLAGALAYLASVVVLAERVVSQSILTYQLSAWRAPFGITLVADALSVFMLVITAVVSLAAVVFSIEFMSDHAQRVSYHPLYHLLLVGVTGAFLTGDLFNLFVWFEVLLLSSYVLVVFYSGPDHTRAALTYTVLNLIGSALMLVAIGGLYATLGTLNMADMARRLANPVQYGVDPIPVLGLTVLLFCVFALKIGVVPFQFWVPAAYRAAPAPVSAMLAGVVKKVGVYAVIRLYFTVFAAASLPNGLGLPGFVGNSFLSFFGPVLFVVAGASILFGGVAAVSRDDFDGVLAYSSIGQIGFVVLPLAVAATVPSVRALGIAAALVYALNHALAKAMLFFASGTVENAVGSVRFAELGGLAKRTPLLAIAVLLGMLSLIGIPPLIGFFGKFLVFQTTAHAGAAGEQGAALALALSVVGAILTVAYFTRAWNRGFWGTMTAPVEHGRYSSVQVGVVVVLAALLVVVGIGFDPVWRAANAAANATLARGQYVGAVLGGGG